MSRLPIQALYAGSVVSVIVAMLLLLAFLDNPVSGGIGKFGAKAMERALILIDESVEASDIRVVLPCDESGRPLA